jgi:hypothetical protein
VPPKQKTKRKQNKQKVCTMMLHIMSNGQNELEEFLDCESKSSDSSFVILDFVEYIISNACLT